MIQSFILLPFSSMYYSSNLDLLGFCFCGFIFVSPLCQHKLRNACIVEGCILAIEARLESKTGLDTINPDSCPKVKTSLSLDSLPVSVTCVTDRQQRKTSNMAGHESIFINFRLYTLQV